MKKTTRVSIAILLSLCFVLLAVGTVFAKSPVVKSPIAWTDPTARATDASLTFTGTVMDMWQLPGTMTLSSGLYVPTGLPEGQAQFGGKGLMISGLPDGRFVQACFNFPVYNNSWAGMIYKWDGMEWVAMPTTITPGDAENPANTYACTSMAGNGTYALIIGFYGTPQPRLRVD